MAENEVKTVSIPIDEYFGLRQKAEMNLWLTNELSEIRARYFDFDRRIYELEQKLKGGAK